MKLLKHIAALFLLFAALSSCSKNNLYVEPVAGAEGGALYRSSAGAFYVVELRGTFKQMGRQYGLLLGPHIRGYYDTIVNQYLLGEKGVAYADILQQGRANYNSYPQIFKDYYEGIAETCGLSHDQVIILSSSFIDLYNTGCSSLSAWGDYTTDGYAIVGRNLDLLAPGIRKFAKYFQVVVWNPTGYPASVANIDLMGSIFYQTSMNSKGIFLELQNGQNCDTLSVPGRENVNNILLESLFRNTNPDEVDQWFKTNLPEIGLIMNSTFPSYATIYEWATFRVQGRSGNGLVSASNDFTDPSWRNYPIVFFDSTNEGIGKTVTRRQNLLKLGEQNKGNIDPLRMMEIFDLTIPDGGATFANGSLISTIYSVVVKPSELKMWLKVRGISGWEEIDLKPRFGL